MRSVLLALAFLVALPALSGCIVRTSPRHKTYRSRNCRTSCVQYARRRRCTRRCHVWRNGVCVAYRQHCSQSRYCVRRATRCR